MKNKTLSLIALTAAALLPCVNATAEAITVYDENNNIVAERSTLSSITSAVDGTSGLTVDISTNIIVDGNGGVLALTEDTSLSLVSSGDESCVVKCSGIKGSYAHVIKSTADNLNLFIDNIVFDGNGLSSRRGIAGKDLSIGGNALFRNFSAEESFSGTAIYAKSIVFEEDSDVTFIGNRSWRLQGGAINTTDGITVKKGAKISFVENLARHVSTAATPSQYSCGGAVYGNVNVEEGGEVVFRGNDAMIRGGAVYGDVVIGKGGKATFSSSVGGAVYGNVTIGDSAIVSFSGNYRKNTTSSSYEIAGGAVYGNVVIGKNAQVEFLENSVLRGGDGKGGAIHGAVTIADGAHVVFSKNKATYLRYNDTSYGNSYGGAIYYGGSIKLSGKRVEFSENETTVLSRGDMYTSGGAIYAGTLIFESGGEEFIFSKNRSGEGGAVYVSSNLTSADGFAGTITYFENTALLYGGAIYGAKTVTISGKDILFTDNTAGTSGGAIYAAGALTFSGANTKVTFSGNKIGNDTDGWTNNDIYATSSVVIQDAGTYSFGGGIVATSTLSISEANVTFESGAVNAITGKTTISGAGTVVRFENTGNAFTGGLTVSTDASVEVVLTEAAKSTAIFNLNSKSLTIDDGLKITVADIDAVSLVAGTAYSYQIFDTAAGLSESHFTLDASLGSSWVISGYDAGVLTLTAIPEPSAFGLLAGLGALALAGMRRRRK